MHRTRHSSLDFLGGAGAAAEAQRLQQDDWAAFLSTSMTVLATADDEPERESPGRGPRSPLRAAASPFHAKALAADADASDQENPNNNASSNDADNGSDTFDARLAPAAARRKPRGGSMSESLTSSTGSSPSGVAWRPLGRRLTAPQPQAQAAARSPTDGAADARPPAFLRLASSPALSAGGQRPRQLRHASSLRDVVSSCLSSSDSSFYDSSSSSDDEAQPVGDDASQPPPPAGPVRPGIIDVDPAYAESCLPVLSAIPGSGISVDTGSLSRSNSLAHVKSPVLSSRRDSQTWQLQDEELLTSPRFGALHGNNQLDSPPPGLFGPADDAFLQREPSNQYEDEFNGSTRPKDVRASSVDFTFSRSAFDVNPPLPPPQEPMQRLRARSFSYSAAYGSSGYNPPPPGYGKPFGMMMTNQQPQMPPTLSPDFPQTLRGFHNGPRGPPSGSQHMPQHMSQTQPPPAGVRPPRVNIPADSPLHQYHQYGPPMLYRRYSTDAFVAPPYRDSYNEQEHHTRQGLSNRGIRSYSMENEDFSTRPMRSQSMEGQAFFAADPPVQYPSLSRSSSAGVGFDWSRARMDSAPSPPLPPDVRPAPSSAHYVSSPPPEAYYDVEFKRGRQEVFAGRAIYNPGEYVKVEADRGEDIGRIVQRTTDLSKIHGEPSPPSDEHVMTRPKRHDMPVKKIIGVASQRECEMLSEQRKEEQDVFEVCKSKVRQRLLPMNVIDAEYQFDRHKLTFFFEADRRIDFRELVRDLFAIYKTRIWLQQVVPTGKKATGEGDAN